MKKAFFTILDKILIEVAAKVSYFFISPEMFVFVHFSGISND